MAKYDVYGLGNALVDIECEVEPAVLQELGIEKGVMTLLDEESQNKILAHFDGQPLKRACGGSAANTVIAVKQFGGNAFYSCKVANDETGQFYAKDLKDCGVDTNLDLHEPETGISGKCLVFITPDADRTMNTFLGVSSELSEADLVPEAIADSQYTYVEGYLVTGDSSRAAAIKARELAQAANQRVAFTLSDPNMVKFFKDGLLDIIGPGVDLLFANESEAKLMAGTESLDDAIEYLKTLSKCLAITLGPEGSIIFDGNNRIKIDPVPTTAVDTVGAGDIYAGGVLYAVTHGMGFFDGGRLGSLASSRLVANVGPRLTTPEMEDFIAWNEFSDVGARVE
ncbi:MAG: adenosine kinase [Leptolyngbyaceae cyanobacterium]